MQLGYQRELDAGWDMYSRATLSWQDRPAETNLTDRFASSKTRFGLSAGVMNTELGLDIRIWGKNLGDTDFNVDPGRQANGDPTLPEALQGSFTPGQEYGVTLRYTF